MKRKRPPGGKTGGPEKEMKTTDTRHADAVGVKEDKRRLVNGVIYLPFDKDLKIVKFAQERVQPHYGGEVVHGPNSNVVVGPNDHIVVVSHGNCATVHSHESDKADGFVQLELLDLAEILGGMLPAGYQGTITLWSCQAAQPWRSDRQMADLYKTVVEEFGTDVSLTRLLHANLVFYDAGIKLEQVCGPIGYITIDREIHMAKVYADKRGFIFGENVDAIGKGIVGADTKVSDDFYIPFVSEAEERATSEVVPTTTTSQSRAARLKARTEKREEQEKEQQGMGQGEKGDDVQDEHKEEKH
jgi:hypothetical protein